MEHCSVRDRKTTAHEKTRPEAGQSLAGASRLGRTEPTANAIIQIRHMISIPRPLRWQISQAKGCTTRQASTSQEIHRGDFLAVNANPVRLHVELNRSEMDPQGVLARTFVIE